MDELLQDVQRNLDAIPDVFCQKDKYRYVMGIVQKLENFMKKELEGSTRNPDYQHLYGGIKIKDAFEKKFAKDMDKAGKKTNDNMTDGMIVTAFRNSGAFDSFFVYPEAVFRTLAKEQVKHIEKPALKCADRVHDEIVKIADRFFNEQRQTFNLFPELRKSIKTVIRAMLDKKLSEVRRQIQDYIRIQASMVFSLDSSFLEKVSSIRRELEQNLHSNNEHDEGKEGEQSYNYHNAAALLNKLPNGPSSETQILRRKQNSLATGNLVSKLKQPCTTRLIKEMANTYFYHIKMQTQDYIPKLIADRLVTQFCGEEDDSLGQELRANVIDSYEDLVKLPSNIHEQRDKNINKKEHLKDAISEIKAILNAYKYDESEYMEEESASSDEDKDDGSEYVEEESASSDEDKYLYDESEYVEEESASKDENKYFNYENEYVEEESASSDEDV